MKAYIYICLIFCLFHFCINEGKIIIIENPELTAIKCDEYNETYGFSFKAEVSDLKTKYFVFLLNGMLELDCSVKDQENTEIKLFECLIDADHHPLFNENDSITLPENVEEFFTTEVQNWKLYLGKKSVIIGKCHPDYSYSFVPSEKFPLSCNYDNSYQLLTFHGIFNNEKQLPQERNYLSEDEYDYYEFRFFAILDGDRFFPTCTIKVMKSPTQNSGNDILECKIFTLKPLKIKFFTTLGRREIKKDEEDYYYEYLKLEINDEFNLKECKKVYPEPSSSSFFNKFNLLLFITLFLI